MERWSSRSKVIVGVVILAALAVVVAASSDQADQVAAVAIIFVYCLLIVGLVLGTVRLYQGSSVRTQRAMLGGFGAFAVISAVGVAASDDGQAVGFVAQMLIGLAVVDAVVLACRLWSRRVHHQP